MSKLYFKVASDWQEVVRLRTEISKLEAQIKSMDANKAPQAVAVLNNQMQQTKQQMQGMITEAAKAGAVMENDFKSKIYQGSQAVNDFTQKIINQKAVVKDVEADVRRLGESYRSALKNNPISASGKLSEYTSAKKALDEEKASLFGLTQQQANAHLSVKKLRDEYALYKNDAKGVSNANSGMSMSFGKMLGVVGGVAAIKHLGSEIIRVRGEFQSMQTAIETLVGKDMAGNLIPQIKELAKVSPLTLSDMVGAEKMMLGFNIKAEDTIRYLQALGDISMGNSQKFNSLTLAFSQTSAAGKLMGQDLNQMINAGFNPLQQIALNTGKSIAQLKDEMSKGAISAEMVQKAFVDATSAGGKFFGMSENASKTINGQISMMQDAMDEAFNEMGQKSEGVIMSGIQLTTKLVENYETVGKILSGLVVTYGAYRAAVMLSTIATGKYTITEVALTNVRAIARKAQMALNASMLSNPYVLFATAVVGLCAAMWAMSDGATAAARAQNEYNEIKEASIKIEKEHKQKIEELLTLARDESLATLTRQKSLEELREEYPKIFEKYDIEKLMLMDILKLKQQINEEDSRRSTERKKKEYSSLKETVKNQQIYLDLFDNPDLRKNLSDEYLALWKQTATSRSYVQVRDEMKKNESKLKLLQNDLLEDNIASYKVNLKNYSKEKLETELKMAQSSESKLNGFNVDGMMVKGAGLEGIISSINGALSEMKEPSIYKEDLAKAKTEWESAKKALSKIEKDKGEFTTKQYDDAKKRFEAAEKAYKGLGGVTSAELNNQESSAEKLRKQQEAVRKQQNKIAGLERKQAFDRRRQTEDLATQLAQSAIDSELDASKKIQMQRDLDNKKEIQALERQKEDYKNAVIQFEKEKFEAQEELSEKQTKGYKKKPFDPSAISVDTSIFDIIISNTTKQQQNGKMREQEDAWNEYLIKFGSYQDKRKALIEKYDKEIAGVEKGGGKEAILLKEKQTELDDLDNSVKNSATLMGQLFSDASQKSASEIQKVIEKAELLIQYLGSVKDEQGNAQIGGKTVSKKDIINLGISDNTLQNLELSTEHVESLRNAIDRLKGDLGSKSPFKLFETQIETATKKITQGGKKNISQGITEIGEAIKSFSPAVSQFGKDLGNIFGSDDLGNKIADVSDAIGGLGQTAAGVGQIMSGDIVGGAMSAVFGISSVVSAFEGLFGADYSHYNEMKEQYEALSSIWDDLIDKKMEYLEMSTTEERKRAEEESLDMIQNKEQAARNLGKERLNSGASSGSHSIGVRTKNNMSKEGWDAAEKALEGDFNKATDNRMTGLFDLSVEQLKKLKEKAPEFWAKMDGDVKIYLEDVIECGKKSEEAIEKAKELWAGISFDSLADNFKSTLADMNSSAEDSADDFQQYMMNAIIDSFINGEEFQKRLKAWHSKLAEYSKSDNEITLDEKNDLKKDWDGMVQDGIDYRNNVFESMGFERSVESTSQNSTKGGFETMSQDTGEELNGRFTALQIAGEEIKSQSLLQVQSLSILTMKSDAILMVNTDIKNIADETRTILANSYLELQEIRENTGAIIKPIKDMAADIADVKKNTSKL